MKILGQNVTKLSCIMDVQPSVCLLTDAGLSAFLSVFSVGLWQDNHLHQQSAHHQSTTEEARTVPAAHGASRGLGGIPEGPGEGEQEESQGPSHTGGGGGRKETDRQH